MAGDVELLPSWREGPARRALVDLLERVDDVPPERRVAVLDNDGTLWCEKPHYPQLDFLVTELRERAASDPSLRADEAYVALLDGDRAAIDRLGLVTIGLRLMELFRGQTPEAFAVRVRGFFDRLHVTGRPYRDLTYRPMLELLDALRRAGITPMVVSGGGQEFLRAVSLDLYGIPPWHVVGTTVAYEVQGRAGVPVLRRTADLLGDVDEGDAKVANVRLHIGTRPVLAAGNSAGDARMLDFVAADDGDGLALLIDHDDPAREYAYESVAGSFAAAPVLDMAAERHWTVASMRDDWTTVFG